MNEQLKDTYLWRATIVENLDSLVAYPRKRNKSQLSLFDEQDDQIVSLKEPTDVNYKDIYREEKDKLGICLTYNELDKYILEQMIFCNNTIDEVHEIIENNNNIIFIGIIDDIEYKKSQYGNFYAKITFRDTTSSISLFLFGDMYKKHISSVIKNKCYLVKATYDSVTQRNNLVSLKNVEELELSKYISGIVLTPKENASDLIFVKEYFNKNINVGNLDLYFEFNGEKYKHPIKIKLSEENYLDIKKHIKSINIIRI